ncbi:protein MTSS 2 isoform X2 [Lutzomyia longipalpis]|uniref:protein MTSS 2 isoform X2 n=1 Tax=Lutzomyia longipalpis TaxID=7200 RepID=UPI0024833F76|nr:protein MTSS 2 isoform X2 [Lutzomyia longipalpis]XP_055686323.1 protein MTSS 2 isoform X2 [Lutzomyia longipalpis]
MDLNLEHPVGTAMGSLFQLIIADLKNSTPLWEDLVMKASKLHMCLRSAIQAISTYLDAFQKIADAATNSKGGSKEIGTALTRVCLRHKAVETKMKSFTAAIMDCLIAPLQEKIEEWKRQVAIIDKDHTKEYKRCRAELKKRSTDTLRLQKKARKGQSDTMQSLVNSSLHDMTQRRAELEEIEKKSLRIAMVEERERYCTFVNFLQPVVKEEYEVMYELSHLQEAMDAIVNVTKDPNVLPPSSEEIILATKSTMNLYPESPGAASGGGGSSQGGCSASLGSRKSSVCSINSLNSSGSAGSQHQRSLSQLISPAIRLKLAESNDSGFCSSQTSTASQSHIMSTWPPNSQDPAVSAVDRPHTISSTYERGHQRPALTVYTFQNPEVKAEPPKSTNSIRPPLPIRCSSLERSSTVKVKPPSSLPAHVTKDYPQMQPTYVNMTELASMAASKLSSTLVQQKHNTAVAVLPKEVVQQLSSPDINESSSSTATPQNASPVSAADVTVTPTKGDDDDTKILGSSVMAKTSMFEKLEQIQANVLKRVDSKLVKKPDREADKLHHDSIEKLNSLIDELDLLQRGVVEIPKIAIEHEVERKDEVIIQQEYMQHNCEVVTLRYKEPKVEAVDGVETRNRVTSFKQSPQSPTTPTTVDQCDGVFRNTNRPAISPRPASLSASRSRRSSVNSAKPPPPVRRSSSVTPSQQLNKLATQNLSQQNLMNVSSESLPPPPAYLLDSENISQSAGSVAEAIKALTDLKHFPASPEILRRTQQSVNSTSKPRISPSQLYAQPKVNKVSSFRHQSHSPTPSGGDFHSSSSSENDSNKFYGRHSQSPSSQQQQLYYRLSDHQKSNMTTYGGQEDYLSHHHNKRLSGKAFAVRNIINSQTLPDPRICHATLMDQIKRGATLKPNKTCNDRSAPKIH